MTMTDGWELLFDPPYNAKAARFMNAMVAAAPSDVDVTPSYRGRRRLLMLYGPGSPERLPVVRRHVDAGGHVAMWDLGYWDRDRAMRLAIDSLHPTVQQLARTAPVPRREFVLREDADPDGGILLIGLGRKSLFAYGIGDELTWERAKLADLRARYPGRTVYWRPKGERAIELDGLPMRHAMPIEEALRGLSLVAVRHSNVAVDAAVAGVPVECEDGAALALYRDGPRPTREQRLDFLARLSWWNWRADEAVQAWAYLDGLLARTLGERVARPHQHIASTAIKGI